MDKQPIVVCDIDGVIFSTEYLLKEIYTLGLKGDKKWEHFYTNCNSERTHLVEGALDLIKIFQNSGVSIIFSTARNEKCRQETINRLVKSGITFKDIFMRRDGDLRPSHEIKREHLEEIMQKGNIVLFIDDDLSNCEMAKSLGIQALRKV